MRDSVERACYNGKITIGKTRNEAMRCLRRRLADHLWRLMIADERQARTGPGGHSGAARTCSAAASTPITSPSYKTLPERRHDQHYEPGPGRLWASPRNEGSPGRPGRVTGIFTGICD